MAKFIIVVVFTFLPVFDKAQAVDAPHYIVEFSRTYLAKFVKPFADRIKITLKDGYSGPNLEIQVYTNEMSLKGSVVYAKYVVRFDSANSLPKSISSPHVEIHKMSGSHGNYLGPAITGEAIIPISGGALFEGSDYDGVLRSLFRADPQLHPFNRSSASAKMQLTPPQREVLSSILASHIEKSERNPGLLELYQAHRAKPSSKVFHAAAVLPTGIGKTHIALEFVKFFRAINKGIEPLVIYAVQNKQILNDVRQKSLAYYKGSQILQLYGDTAFADVNELTRMILVTRSTYANRLGYIHKFAKDYKGPVLLYRDEAHHTGKEWGQWQAILENFLARMDPEDAVLDWTATPWHQEDLKLVLQYEGRIATAFLEPEEANLLRQGHQVERIARLQLLRAMAGGWLSPLTGVSFITSGTSRSGKELKYPEMLMRDQAELAKDLNIGEDEIGNLLSTPDISEKVLTSLRELLLASHGHIIKGIAEDLRSQWLTDDMGRVAEWDRGLIFVPSILHAQVYETTLNSMFRHLPANFRLVHSQMTPIAAQANVDWLNDMDDDVKPDQHKYLINVSIMREGVDVPGINRIVFAAATDDLKVMIQALGRGARLSSRHLKVGLKDRLETIPIYKSGVRLTDFSGSYLGFFKDLPTKLLGSVLTPGPEPVERKPIGKPPTVQINGKARELEYLVRYDIAEAEAEVVNTRELDEERLVEEDLARKFQAEGKKDPRGRLLKKYYWTLNQGLPDTDSESVRELVQNVANFAPKAASGVGRSPLGEALFLREREIHKLVQPWVLYFASQDLSAIEIETAMEAVKELMDKGFWRPYQVYFDPKYPKYAHILSRALNIEEGTDYFDPLEDLLMGMRGSTVSKRGSNILLDRRYFEPDEFKKYENLLTFLWMLSAPEGRSLLAQAPEIERAIKAVFPRADIYRSSRFYNPHWISEVPQFDQFTQGGVLAADAKVRRQLGDYWPKLNGEMRGFDLMGLVFALNSKHKELRKAARLYFADKKQEGSARLLMSGGTRASLYLQDLLIRIAKRRGSIPDILREYYTPVSLEIFRGLAQPPITREEVVNSFNAAVDAWQPSDFTFFRELTRLPRTQIKRYKKLVQILMHGLEGDDLELAETHAVGWWSLINRISDSHRLQLYMSKKDFSDAFFRHMEYQKAVTEESVPDWLKEPDTFELLASEIHPLVIGDSVQSSVSYQDYYAMAAIITKYMPSDLSVIERPRFFMALPLLAADAGKSLIFENLPGWNSAAASTTKNILAVLREHLKGRIQQEELEQYFGFDPSYGQDRTIDEKREHLSNIIKRTPVEELLTSQEINPWRRKWLHIVDYMLAEISLREFEETSSTCEKALEE